MRNCPGTAVWVYCAVDDSAEIYFNGQRVLNDPGGSWLDSVALPTARVVASRGVNVLRVNLEDPMSHRDVYFPVKPSHWVV